MEKIIHGQPIKRGQILEVVFTNVKHPIKAVVLDIIGYPTGSNSKHYECIMYAQKRLFKASFKYNGYIGDHYNYSLNTTEEKDRQIVTYRKILEAFIRKDDFCGGLYDELIRMHKQYMDYKKFHKK